MPSSDTLDNIVGQVVGTLFNSVEYRQVLSNPQEGEKHVTPDGREWTAVREAIVDGKVVQSPLTIHWRGPASPGAAKSFKMTTLFVEPKGLFLEGNGGFRPDNTLGGAAFMSPQLNASGTIWKMIPLSNGLFHLTTSFVEDKGLVLEGNGGLDSNNTLGGAAFMSPQRDASGTMWKIIPQPNGFFQLTTLFVEGKGLVLEGNGGFDSNNTLGGAAFMSPQTNASGTMWRFVPFD
jgi:hypothetical protein